MIIVDAQTGDVRIARCDTGVLTFELECDAPLTDAVAVLDVESTLDKMLLRMQSPIVTADGNMTATFRLTNAITRTLPVGQHRYSLRIITNPETDSSGRARCRDDTDEVHAPLAYGTRPPTFTVLWGGEDV